MLRGRNILIIRAVIKPCAPGDFTERHVLKLVETQDDAIQICNRNL